MGHIFEAMMLVCFGFSWPLNVIKAYKARTAKGTSLAFIILIITGYVAGIAAKFINHQTNYVLVVYFLNLVIVLSNVVVYFRNVALDNKNNVGETKRKLYEIKKRHENDVSYTYSQEENMNYKELNEVAKNDGVVLMGGSFDQNIPVAELAQSFEFNFGFYNRSTENISVRNAKEFFKTDVAPISPEGMIIHIGDSDIQMFKNNADNFDKSYMELIDEIKKSNSKIRIALVSVNNPNGKDIINDMNSHIKSIADSEKCTFINLDNVKLWNPKATKAATDFAYSMGLRNKKPLMDVCKIIYSYACLELGKETVNESLAG